MGNRIIDVIVSFIWSTNFKLDLIVFTSRGVFLFLWLDAYLRSPGLSVGNKLCFLCLHLPKFFYAIIGVSCNCFLPLVCQRCRFLTYVYRYRRPYTNCTLESTLSRIFLFLELRYVGSSLISRENKLTFP